MVLRSLEDNKFNKVRYKYESKPPKIQTLAVSCASALGPGPLRRHKPLKIPKHKTLHTLNPKP